MSAVQFERSEQSILILAFRNREQKEKFEIAIAEFIDTWGARADNYFVAAGPSGRLLRQIPRMVSAMYAKRSKELLHLGNLTDPDLQDHGAASTEMPGEDRASDNSSTTRSSRRRRPSGREIETGNCTFQISRELFYKAEAEIKGPAAATVHRGPFLYVLSVCFWRHRTRH